MKTNKQYICVETFDKVSENERVIVSKIVEYSHTKDKVYHCFIYPVNFMDRPRTVNLHKEDFKYLNEL